MQNAGMTTRRFKTAISLCAAGLLLQMGCSVKSIRTATRTPTEQILTSRAIEKAIGGLEFGERLQGKSVFIQSTTLDKQEDSDYVLDVMRARCLECGAVMAATQETADLTLRLFTSLVGAETRDADLGIPIEMPALPGLGGSGEPLIDINFVRFRRYLSMARFWGYAVDSEGRPVFGIGPATGKESAVSLSVMSLELFARGGGVTDSGGTPATGRSQLIPSGTQVEAQPE